jgi:Chaperone of endosialidase
MAAQQPTPQSARIPPDVPNDPGISGLLSAYLRNFALWCREGFAEQMRNNQALRGVMLLGYDTPPGETPPVWMLECNVQGQLGLGPMMLGSRQEPGDFVPIGEGMYQTAGWYLPTDSSGYVQRTLPIRSTDNAYAYVGFFDATSTRRGWVGWSTGNAGIVINNDVSNCSLLVGDDGANHFIGGLNVNGKLIPSSFQTTGSHTIFQTAGYLAQATGGSVMIQQNDAGSQVFQTFHIAGQFACNFGMDVVGNFYCAGWSFGVNNAYKFWTQRDFANPCDYRSKADVQPLGSTWDVVKTLKPVSYFNKKFDWVEEDGLERWGFIAHELQETILESAATGVKDEPNRVQSPNMLVIIAALTRTVQELQARVEALEAR